MLRITIHDNAACLTFQVEGTFTGPWVHEAGECWRRLRATRCDRPVRIDLAGVTAIDAAGKDFLNAMHAERAELVAHGCLMRAIVAEITGAPIPGCGDRQKEPRKSGTATSSACDRETDKGDSQL